jgi:hypothetical protein
VGFCSTVWPAGKRRAGNADIYFVQNLLITNRVSKNGLISANLQVIQTMWVTGDAKGKVLGKNAGRKI